MIIHSTFQQNEADIPFLDSSMAFSNSLLPKDWPLTDWSKSISSRMAYFLKGLLMTLKTIIPTISAFSFSAIRIFNLEFRLN